jgi:hypothetical protein
VDDEAATDKLWPPFSLSLYFSQIKSAFNNGGRLLFDERDLL